jgi:DNA-binding MarR family transcriptional regulator
MKKDDNQVREDLEMLFHQPHRLNIMAELCGSEEGRTFGELKETLDLTDGNLSRHIQSLEKAGAVKVKKSFVDSRPQTTVFATARGRENFLDYLTALEGVLKQAAKRAGCEVRDKTIIAPNLKTSKA